MSFWYKRHETNVKDIMNNIKDNIKDIVKKDTLFYIDKYDINSVLSFNKLEKLNIAIYMITDFLSDSEPLKFSLREKNIKCLSFTLSLISRDSDFTDELITKINLVVSEINSLLKIALISNLISEMNYTVLNEEYKIFLNSLTKSNFEDKKIILDKDFFKEKSFNINNKYIYKGQIYKRQEKQKVIIKDIVKDTPKYNNLKDIIKDKKVVKDKTNRQELIIDFIKKNKEVSIKDISSKIKDCSEKTLQRELVTLVNKNVLKKEGERRWSKYSLI